MPDVKIRFRDGVITLKQAASKPYVLAAPPPSEPAGEPVMYAFEPATDELETWVSQHECGELLARALAEAEQAAPEEEDREQLVNEVKTKSAPLAKLADELAAKRRPVDPKSLLAEAGRRRLLETVTIYGGAYYSNPLALLPRSIPSISWIAGQIPQVRSVYSNLEVVLLYDLPNYGPDRSKPRAIVWPNTGIPFLTFPPGSISVS